MAVEFTACPTSYLYRVVVVIPDIDGAYFGTTFPHLFFMTFPAMVPSPLARKYVPRVFGFKIYTGPLPGGKQEKPKSRRKKKQLSNGGGGEGGDQVKGGTDGSDRGTEKKPASGKEGPEKPEKVVPEGN